MRRLHHDCSGVARHGAGGTEKLPVAVGRQRRAIHKPALATAVSAAEGGAYVIAELRMSSYKNNRLCWIPEHLIARRVKSICNDDITANDDALQQPFAERANYAIDLLLAYADALGGVRASGVINHDAFMNGM